MANEGQKRMLIDSIARADKEVITLKSDIKKKSDESNKLNLELNKSNTTDSRKKSIISRNSTLQKDIVNLEKKIKDKEDKRNKDKSKLDGLS